MIGQSHVPRLMEASAKNNDKMHELMLLQGEIDCFLPEPARLSCVVQSSLQQGHVLLLTDSAWHTNIFLLFHHRVEACDSNVMDTPFDPVTVREISIRVHFATEATTALIALSLTALLVRTADTAPET